MLITLCIPSFNNQDDEAFSTIILLLHAHLPHGENTVFLL